MHEGLNIKAGFNPEEERTISAAVRYRGEVFSSVTHGDAWNACREKFPDANSNDAEEGFITSTGRFVSENEAYEMLENAGKER